jgi:crooked neck
VPHSSFTFAKLWLLAAKLEVRAQRLPAARKILGLALGTCPKGKLFKEYIQLEMTLGNIDRWESEAQGFRALVSLMLLMFLC